MSKFEPNAATFQDGIDRVAEAIAKAGAKVGHRVMTSHDKEAVSLSNLLAVDSVPEGFKKWQLPFVFKRGQFFISVANPNVSVPKHSHEDGDGIRFIVGGSIYYDGKELKSGDWMFIPKNVEYSFVTGPMGAVMFYCYECCCARRLLNRGDWVINPEPFKGMK